MDKTKLVVKNLPSTNQDIKDNLKSQTGAISVKSYGRCRALLRFADEIAASFALRALHQTEFFGRTLCVEYLGNRILHDTTDETQKPTPTLSSFLKDLYATSIPHGFEQPPPPYFKYNYPPINRTILDSISIALLTNNKFYQQVLHLMNRMNLDPPFLPPSKPFVPPGEPCDAQTQTDERIDTKNSLLASGESELESDDEKSHAKVNRKRKKNADSAIIKTKVRKIISSQILEKHDKLLQSAPRKEVNRDGVFEEVKNVSKKISLNISALKLPEHDGDNSNETLSNSTVSAESSLPSPFVGGDLSINRIPESQCMDLAVFKNYQRGERSNKLYIKNLSKDVSEKDLESIYSRFVQNEKEISIKLMLYGKMKGQAFVTFLAVGDNYDAVEKALDETNGYILKCKPMVVCFAKKS